MPEYLAPDVYVEEVDTNRPIEGVSTSTTAFVGFTRRGPVTGRPQLVTSFTEFRRQYGGHFDLGPTFLGHNGMPFAVDGFFTNRGKRLYVVRVVPAAATPAKTTTKGGLITRLAEDTDPSTPDKVRLATLRGIQVGSHLTLQRIKDGLTTTIGPLTVTALDRNTGVATVNPASVTSVLETRHTAVVSDSNGIDAAGLLTAGAAPASFAIEARDPGSWGKDVRIQAFHEAPTSAELDLFQGYAAPTELRLSVKSGAGFYARAWVEIDRGKTKRYLRVKTRSANVLTFDAPAGLVAADFAPEAPATTTILSVCEFRLVVSYEDATERFSGLTLEKVPGHYYVDVVGAASDLVTVDAAVAATHPLLFPSGPNGLSIALDTNGIDGAAGPSDTEYRGKDNGPGKRTGIQALSDIDEISIVAAPGLTSQSVQQALIEHCEKMRYRFAILDPKPKAASQAPDIADVQAQRSLYDTKYAALYYPRLIVLDPLTEVDVAAPPSGHIAGIYARSDNDRGVHKAPANEVIAGISDLELLINKAEQEILNPSPTNINVLRDFRPSGRSLRVWGARVVTSDPAWKYVNVRRLFNFVEKSIEQGTQWAVFEPNDERLWARVTQSVSQFLTRVWRDGALMGSKPEEAFFVKCDRTTMVQDDFDNGRLIMLVGICPVKPAEFVIIRIGQWAGGSAVEEL